MLTDETGNSGGAKGFVTNMFKNPFKRDGDTSRKASDAGSLTGNTGEPTENKGTHNSCSIHVLLGDELFFLDSE